MNENADFIVIGAGLAGSEAALRLAHAGAKVDLYEQKPQKFSAVHQLPYAAELVCSNSFKSLEIQSAHGLLKEELRILKSPVLEIAMQSRVPGGKALVVDREKMAQDVTETLKDHPLINWQSKEIENLNDFKCPVLVATGPLTSDGLMTSIREKLGDKGLYFYDATSPVVTLDSLDMSAFFWASRNQDGDDYLNLPLNREQYYSFRNQVLAAEKVEAHHPDEKLQFFEGCLPIEELARRGEDTLAFSCMKPIGFDPKVYGSAVRPYAIIQFRREKAAGDLLSMVGFQTRMKWPEQERVFRQLPGMANANFVRLGAMHRNSFINAPLHLNDKLQLKKFENIFMAGQITGSEGYTEALASGHYAALQMLGYDLPPDTSAIRSLIRYIIHSDPRYFQPMNFNFGLLPPLLAETGKIKKRSKSDRHRDFALRAIADLQQWIQLKDGLKNSFNKERSFDPLVLTPTELVKLTSNA